MFGIEFQILSTPEFSPESSPLHHPPSTIHPFIHSYQLVPSIPFISYIPFISSIPSYSLHPFRLSYSFPLFIYPSFFTLALFRPLSHFLYFQGPSRLTLPSIVHILILLWTTALYQKPPSQRHQHKGTAPTGANQRDRSKGITPKELG
jgi:hypothetical protein